MRQARTSSLSASLCVSPPRKGGRYQSKLGSLLTKFTSSGGRGEEEVGVGVDFDSEFCESYARRSLEISVPWERVKVLKPA